MSRILITYIVHLLECGASYHPVPLGELHIAAMSGVSPIAHG